MQSNRSRELLRLPPANMKGHPYIIVALNDRREIDFFKRKWLYLWWVVSSQTSGRKIVVSSTRIGGYTLPLHRALGVEIYFSCYREVGFRTSIRLR